MSDQPQHHHHLIQDAYGTKLSSFHCFLLFFLFPEKKLFCSFLVTSLHALGSSVAWLKYLSFDAFAQVIIIITFTAVS